MNVCYYRTQSASHSAAVNLFVCFAFISKMAVGKCEAKQLSDVVDGEITVLCFNVLSSLICFVSVHMLFSCCSHAVNMLLTCSVARQRLL